MTSKNFKFGDLGDSSINNFVRYRLSNFEQYLIYRISHYNINIVVHVWVVRLWLFFKLSKASLLDYWKISGNWLELQTDFEQYLIYGIFQQNFNIVGNWLLLHYFIFREISEISTHYNNITFLKFRGNIRNLAVSIEVLQTCLK